MPKLVVKPRISKPIFARLHGIVRRKSSHAPDRRYRTSACGAAASVIGVTRQASAARTQPCPGGRFFGEQSEAGKSIHGEVAPRVYPPTSGTYAPHERTVFLSKNRI